MKTPESDTSAAAVLNEDDRLLQLELKVAQRADELSQAGGRGRGRDLEHWLRAEQEILEPGRSAPQSRLAGAGG